MLASNPDPTDPWLREAQTFPVLSAEMIQRVSSYGEEWLILEDTLLFERGQRGIDFFLVLEGEIQVLADDARTGRSCLFVYRAGQFSGEQNLFTKRQMLLQNRELSRLSNRDFRSSTCRARTYSSAEIWREAFGVS
jgi:thioredoxin reductase (NADPH)